MASARETYTDALLRDLSSDLARMASEPQRSADERAALYEASRYVTGKGRGVAEEAWRRVEWQMTMSSQKEARDGR